MKLRNGLLGVIAASGLVIAGLVPAAAASTAAGAATGSADGNVPPAVACVSLVDADLGENASVVSAVDAPADATTPASCRVTVSTTHPPAGDDVITTIYLPSTGWNGRFVGIGGGGYSAGNANTALAHLRLGFATGFTNAGNPTNTAAGVGLNADNTVNEQGHINWGYLSIHEMTVIGKALVQVYYGQAPDYSYFNGCSTGGRQGVTEAQRYPEDYDGILAGAPVINYFEMQIAQLWPQVVMREEGIVIPPCEFEAAQAAAIQACDTAGDGVADGVIGDPLACDFDLGTLVGTVTPCGTITAEDVAILEKIRQGPRNPEGEFIWYGLPFGTRYSGIAGPAPFAAGVQVIAAWLEQNPALTWNDLDLTYDNFESTIDELLARYGATEESGDPNLQPFADAGGKLLMWHGWGDFGVMPQGSIDYYERVQKALTTRTRDSVRLFLAPGVDHCGGGPGLQPTGQLDALIAWVEQGKAPKTLQSVRTSATGEVVATRPICAYPRVAAYDGSGDVADGSNYSCVRAEQLIPGVDPKESTYSESQAYDGITVSIKLQCSGNDTAAVGVYIVSSRNHGSKYTATIDADRGYPGATSTLIKKDQPQYFFLDSQRQNRPEGEVTVHLRKGPAGDQSKNTTLTFDRPRINCAQSVVYP